MPKVSLILLIVFFTACKLTSADKEPLFKKDLSNEAERKNTLFVFVGEKISAEMQPYDSGSMDGRMIARYKILQRVYGDHKSDTIEFTAYDHYGTPAFSHYKNVLLFVSEYEGKYYHEKYQYYDVYKTKDSRWAGTGMQTGCKEGDRSVDFAEPVFYPWIWRDQCGHSDTFKFDKSCFKLEGEKVIPTTGHYVDELFIIAKNSVLTARGLFGKISDGHFDVKDTELAPVKDSEPEYIGKDSLEVLKVFNQLMSAFRDKDLKKAKFMMLDSMICQPCAIRLFPPECEEPPLVKVSAEDFMNIELAHLENKNFRQIKDQGKSRKLQVYFAKNSQIGNDQYYNFFRRQDDLVIIPYYPDIPMTKRYNFYFTKQNGEFKLRSIYLIW